MYVSWQIEQRVLGPLAFSISLSDELDAVDAVVTVSLWEGVGDDMMTCFKLHLQLNNKKLITSNFLFDLAGIKIYNLKKTINPNNEVFRKIKSNW